MFEDALIESAPHKGDSKKAMTLPVSILIHGLVIGIALGASIWFVEDIPMPPPVPILLLALATGTALGASTCSVEPTPDPPIPVTFYASAPPPPPPPPAAPPKAPQPKAPEVQKQVPVRPVEMVAPTIIPE